MRAFAVFATGLLAALPAAAQTAAPPLPQAHIPAAVLFELRTLEHRFDQALASDCAPEKCFSKGCVYREHATVDLPRSGSLPGLGVEQGPGSVPVQEYLTQARCEFTHEKSLPARDVQGLVKRLEQRLSRGWLRVTIERQPLEPISASLREAPKAPEPPPPPPAPEAKPVVEEATRPEPPATWQADVAGRELWLALLPHFSWMIALLLVTLAALLIIWALRRLGRESIEEKAMLAQLAAGAPSQEADTAPSPAIDANAEASSETPRPADTRPDEGAAVEDHRRVWSDRIAQTELTGDEGTVVELLRDWLRAGEFALLAKAILLFGDRLTLAFPAGGELAQRKVQLAEYLRDLDEKALPSDADFFRKLNQHAISSSLLAHTDAELYRSLREEFGPTGLANLVAQLPPRHGALVFAMAPLDLRHEVARLMSPELRLRTTEQLLRSNRISREELAQIFEALSAARAGRGLPRLPEPAPGAIDDRGQPFDAAVALSVLLPQLDAEDRVELFASALKRASGAFPSWYEDILYPEMLLNLPEELRKDLLLEVDVRGLAGWSSLQSQAWQQRFMDGLAPAIQSAVRAGMSFGSRADQLRLARQGHEELVTAVKRLASRGKISFEELVA